MKKLLLGCLLLTICVSSIAQEKKFLKGFDGGMMIHTGYLKEYIQPLNYQIKGMPMGIGGVIRLHLGNHLRIGSEGYVSTLYVKQNGSYSKLCWGGVLVDGYWQFGKIMPYVGVTIGGGGITTCLMTQGDSHDWETEEELVYNKSTLMIIDPFIGCDFIVSESLHITLKCDYVCGFSKKEFHLPQGPRLYLGFIFYH